MHKIYKITPCQPESGLPFLVFLQKNIRRFEADRDRRSSIRRLGNRVADFGIGYPDPIKAPLCKMQSGASF